MAKYLFIESRDPFESGDAQDFSSLVHGISLRANPTVLVLVQNGVLAARKGCAHNEIISKLIESKVKVLADEFSLRERAIHNLMGGVEVVDMGKIVDLLLEPGTKPIWH
jgi:sulfur relay protein TusB/DsrH